MANVLELIIRAKDEASAAFGKLSDQIRQSTNNWKEMFTAVAATTAVISGIVYGLMKFQAAADEQRKSIALLDIALRNVGVAYGDVSATLDATFKRFASLTNYAIDQQREALGRLVFTTGNYDQSLQYLGLTMDIAAARGMDLISAASLLGGVITGNTRGLVALIGAIDENATAIENLARLTVAYGGLAEATATKTTQMKNALHDLRAAIGESLSPAVETNISQFDDFIRTITESIISIKQLGEANRLWVEGLRDGTLNLRENIFGFEDFIKILREVQGEAGKTESAIGGISEATQDLYTPSGLPTPRSRQRVIITPNEESRQGSPQTINITINNAGSVVTERELAENIRQAFYDIKRNTGNLEMS